MYYDNEDKSNDEILAEALIQIIENQMKIKRHFGLASDSSYYGDCYYDEKVIEALRSIG